MCIKTEHKTQHKTFTALFSQNIEGSTKLTVPASAYYIYIKYGLYRCLQSANGKNGLSWERNYDVKENTFTIFVNICFNIILVIIC